jgi:hypothetical protein
MKAVPRKQLWRCRYICSDHRGCLIFLALPVPVIVLTMNWIDGTALKNLPAGVTIAGILLLLIIVLVILTSLRRAEYNYFEAVAKAAAELEDETPDKIIMELEENRNARLKDFLLRDPEKLFLLGKIMMYSPQNRGIARKMLSNAMEYAPELKEFEEISWQEAAKRYVSLKNRR